MFQIRACRNCYSSECDKGDGKLGEDLISLVLNRGGPVILWRRGARMKIKNITKLSLTA